VRFWSSELKVSNDLPKPPFELRLIGMQEENNDIFFVEFF
jgi:hypothetical protein